MITVFIRFLLVFAISFSMFEYSFAGDDIQSYLCGSADNGVPTCRVVEAIEIRVSHLQENPFKKAGLIFEEVEVWVSDWRVKNRRVSIDVKNYRGNTAFPVVKNARKVVINVSMFDEGDHSIISVMSIGQSHYQLYSNSCRKDNRFELCVKKKISNTLVRIFGGFN